MPYGNTLGKTLEGGPEKLAIYNKWHYSSNTKRQR